MSREVLLQIARCDLADVTRTDDWPCKKVVTSQGVSTQGIFQVPEPWRGDIVNAPVLVVSSNPGFAAGDADDSPVWGQSNDEIVDYFTTRGFPWCFPKNLSRAGRANTRAVSFWSHIHRRVSELYDVPEADVRVGVDYALTEVVHCKSENESKIGDAAPTCVRKHFAEVARLSRAAVVLVLGDLATSALGLNGTRFPVYREWYGRERDIVMLPHPNARTARKISTVYNEGELADLQARLGRESRP